MKFAEFDFELHTPSLDGLTELLNNAEDFGDEVRWSAGGAPDTPMFVTVQCLNSFARPVIITAEELEGTWYGKVQRLPLDGSVDLSQFGQGVAEDNDLAVDSVCVYDDDDNTTHVFTIEEFVEFIKQL